MTMPVKEREISQELNAEIAKRAKENTWSWIEGQRENMEARERLALERGDPRLLMIGEIVTQHRAEFRPDQYKDFLERLIWNGDHFTEGSFIEMRDTSDTGEAQPRKIFRSFATTTEKKLRGIPTLEQIPQTPKSSSKKTEKPLTNFHGRNHDISVWASKFSLENLSGRYGVEISMQPEHDVDFNGILHDLNIIPQDMTIEQYIDSHPDYKSRLGRINQNTYADDIQFVSGMVPTHSTFNPNGEYYLRRLPCLDGSGQATVSITKPGANDQFYPHGNLTIKIALQPPELVPDNDLITNK
jgi:hypothetical protein